MTAQKALFFAGSITSAPLSFQAPACAARPTVRMTRASLSRNEGVVNPNGLRTLYRFAYSIDPFFADPVFDPNSGLFPARPAGDGTDDVAVADEGFCDPLSFGSIIYVRLEALSAAGVSVSEPLTYFNDCWIIIF